MEHLDLPFILTSLSQVGLTVALVAGGAFLLQFLAWFALSRSKKPYAFPLTILVPGIVGLLLFTVIPIGYEFMITFSDMMAKVTAERDYFRNPNFGLTQLIANVSEVFSSTGYLSFFLQTLLYAVVQVFCHFTIGLFLAHLVNRKIRFKNIYRVLLTLPWAIPATIVYKTLGNETDFEYGLINTILRLFDQKPIYFPDNEFLLFLWGNLVVIWASTPLVFLALLGGLQSIPQEFYEAAEMDGVRWGRKLIRITLPLLRPVMIPILFLDFIWTINNGNPAINMWGGPPGLSNAIYYYFNQTPSDYALGATVAFVSFGCLFLVVLGLLKVTGAHTGYETNYKVRKASDAPRT